MGYTYLQAIVFICGLYPHPRCEAKITDCVEARHRTEADIEQCWFQYYGPLMIPSWQKPRICKGECK